MKPTLLTLAAAALCGCTGGYNQGPRFAPVSAPEGYGIVYAFRPTSMVSAAFSSPVGCGAGPDIHLWSGGYGVFLLRPGHHVCAILPASPDLRVEFDLAAGQKVYLRADSSVGGGTLKLVSEADGASGIEDCHLVPGGRGRVRDD